MCDLAKCCGVAQQLELLLASKVQGEPKFYPPLAGGPIISKPGPYCTVAPAPSRSVQ